MDIASTCHNIQIAYYPHLVPVALAMFLSTYALIASRFSKISITFFLFTFSFSLWLVGDLVNWTASPYQWIYFTWSWLDYLNVVFYVLGAYFFIQTARTVVPLWNKLVFLVLCILPFGITVTGHSLLGFNHPVCEAFEYPLMPLYVSGVGVVSMLVMLYSLIASWRLAEKSKKIMLGCVFAAIVLFFVVFNGSGYIASTTEVYEIQLYSLFVLPVFLIVMVFAMTNLQLFQMRYLGTQILAYVLIITTGSQLLFLQNSTDKVLTLATLALSILFGVLLLQNARREAKARVRVEKLANDLEVANERLKELDQMKSEFLSIASHQLRAPITAIKGYISLIREGDYGVVPETMKEPLSNVSESVRVMVSSIEDYLNVSRIEQNRMKYEFSDVDIADLAKKAVSELSPVATAKKLTLSVDAPLPRVVRADIGKIKQVITNLVDNAIKYTLEGSVAVSVTEVPGNVRVTIADTGVGLAKEDIANLFQKFKRADGANQVNTTGTGLGLYVARLLIEGHGGKVWVESEGKGKGSRFIVELPLKTNTPA